MSTQYYKTISNCECGYNYGSCDKTNVFVLKLIGSVDVNQLFYKHHSEQPDSKFELLGSFTDNDIVALSDLLNNKNLKQIEKEELEQIKSCS